MVSANPHLWIGALSLVASRGKGATADAPAPTPAPGAPRPYFRRSATFPVCRQDHPTCDTDAETVAEILAFLPGGDGLVYTDSAGERLGFVDVVDRSAPVADGVLDLGGEPTTVKVLGNYVIAGVNTSPSYVAPAGHVAVIDSDTRAIVATIDLGGQPDAIDVSHPDAPFPWYIVVAVENERDEDLGDGAPPQSPPGKVSFITIADADALAAPGGWTVQDVSMTGLDGCLFPDDPEPESVAMHPQYPSHAAVSLQENNCIAFIDLSDASADGSFSAGTVDLADVDLTYDGVISQTEAVTGVKREPDGIVFYPGEGIVLTSNEGDLDGGARGWSMQYHDGTVIVDSGNTLDLEAVRTGHYPEKRSGKKGNEPENLLMSDDLRWFFVASERSSLVFVYQPDEGESIVQSLPVGFSPEGLAYDAGTSVLAVASEKDDRGDKIRSSIALFELVESVVPAYPTLVSLPRAGAGPAGPFIPFSALSGLASAAPLGAAALAAGDADVLFSVEDSFYKRSRILSIDTSSFPAVVSDEQHITDPDGVLAACLAGQLGDGVAVADLVNDDKTVNLDPEGIAVSSMGGFWIVSEGRGTLGDAEKPYEYPNLLLKLSQDAVVSQCILPDGSFPEQVRFGFEGVAEDGDNVVVAVQRAWGDEPHPRIAVYNTVSETWKHAFYPLETPLSQNGGWVGLSDIAPLGCGKFYVLERDNQGGPDAAIKSITSIELGGYSFPDGTILGKQLVRDLIPDLSSSHGMTFEKVEGLAVTKSGKVWVNNDNDGVDDNSGEQALLHVSTADNNPKTCTGRCIVDSDCALVQKCVKKPEKCMCKDKKCRKKGKTCATRGAEVELWACKDGQQCVAGVKENGKTYKWGKCKLSQ